MPGQKCISFHAAIHYEKIGMAPTYQQRGNMGPVTHDSCTMAIVRDGSCMHYGHTCTVATVLAHAPTMFIGHAFAMALVNAFTMARLWP